MSVDEKYLQRCLQLAANGIGTTRPNPSVGCVIVNNHKIIGEGFTNPYGGPHAEVNAINSIIDKSLLKTSTLYVTLEPCSHHGKTPPCSNLIIKHKIPRVIIGTVDSHEKVSGKGIEILKAAGCNVTIGVLENECQEHHKRFLTFHNKQRPYVILKWAESSDGFIAPLKKEEKKPVWITNPYSRQLVHKWRTEEHAILVGTNTVLEDNPSLTARDWKGNNPVRIVIDKTNKLSKEYQVFDNASETIVITEKDIDFNQPIGKHICDLLFQKKIQSVIIEGGAQTLQTFIDENVWDEARVFSSIIKFKEGVNAPKISGDLIFEKHILKDHLKIYQNSNR